MKVKIDSRIKAIAWDFDGTIINSFTIMKDVVASICRAEGFPEPSDQTYYNNFHGTMHETLYALLGGNLSEEDLEMYFSMFMEKQGVYYETATQYLLDDALVLIESCRKAGLKQVLVTNRNHAHHGNASPHYIVASSVLKDSIHHVLAGDEVEFRKPDARVLGSYLKEHGLKPHEVLVIGDQFVDAQLALNLGTKAILVSRHGHIVNLESLTEGWESHITIVPDLQQVVV